MEGSQAPNQIYFFLLLLFFCNVEKAKKESFKSTKPEKGKYVG